ADEGARRNRLVGIALEVAADRPFGLHLARRAEALPEHSVGALEVGVGRVLDRLELVAPGLALDHLHDILLVEILQAEAAARALGRHRGSRMLRHAAGSVPGAPRPGHSPRAGWARGETRRRCSAARSSARGSTRTAPAGSTRRRPASRSPGSIAMRPPTSR